MEFPNKTGRWSWRKLIFNFRGFLSS